MDQKFSTTRLVSNMKPIFENSPEDKFESGYFLTHGIGRKGEGGLRTKGYFKNTYNNKPLITVATVVLNGASHIETTIKSVIHQTYSNIEYIIIDGCSSDETLNIIKSYDDQIDYWVSERDKGIFDAMNKAITISTGDFISFMNTGDTFFSEHTVEEVTYLLDQNDEIIYGDVLSSLKGMIKAPKKISKFVLYRRNICHQSIFFHKKLFKKLGFYDTKYLIGGDPDWILRAFLKNTKIRYLKIPVCVYAGGGISDNIALLFETKKRLRKIYFSKTERLIFFILDIIMSSYHRILVLDFTVPYLVKRLFVGLGLSKN